MKLIHCADLHLDSPMETHLDPDAARTRKNEILNTFAKLVRLASEGDVAAILIAGDLFDRDHITKKTEKYVLELIRQNPGIQFFYLAGNHDRGSVLKEPENKPENLCTFGNGWTTYRFGEVTVTGSEQPDPDTLPPLDPGDRNIVILHGQEKGAKSVSGGADLIRFASFKNRNIDYIALGHLHEYRTAQIDDRCVAAYSGCPEGRGFDECGEKGYVLLETTQNGITHTFIPLAKRRFHTVPCDVTGFSSQLDLENRVTQATARIPSDDLVKVVLTGSCPAGAQKDLAHLRTVLSENFFFAKIQDDSRLLIRPEDYRNDVSLKGEFIRRVLASGLSEAEKERVIACGIAALTGEEVGL